MASNVRPYENDREAHAAAVAAIPPGPGWSILSQAQCSQLMRDALTAAGVGTSAFEDRTAWWLAGWEDYTCAIIARWIASAHEAGKASATAGSETQWGLRLTIDDGEPIFDPYPSEEVARNMVATFQGVFDTVVVRRDLGPWEEAPDA